MHLVEGNPALKARLAQQPTIDETKDVPDTAGYSKQAGRVYIDRHLARDKPALDGKPYAVWRPCLIVHEWVEKALIDLLGYGYEAAHEFASVAEDEAVKKAGMRPFAYNRGLKPWIKRDEVERIMVPPRDLDCTPYRGPDQDAADKAIMAQFKKLGVADAQGDGDGKVDQQGAQQPAGVGVRGERPVLSN